MKSKKRNRQTTKEKLLNQLHYYQNIELNNQQKEAVKLIEQYPIVVVYGRSGVGKTLLSIMTAWKMYSVNLVKKLVLSRPAVTTEQFGYLPGSLLEKYSVFLFPLIEYMKGLQDQDFEELIENEIVLPMPIAYLRGTTFDNNFILIDEAQNITEEQAKLIITRLGKNSKLVFTGDLSQKDIKGSSGLEKIIKLSKHRECCDYVAAIELTKVERNDCIDKILDNWGK